MVNEVKLPELGENIELAVVVAVLVSPGDSVQRDQSVVELETEKATVELPCPFAGMVREILVKEGDEVRVGQVVLTVETDKPGISQHEADSEVEVQKGQQEQPAVALDAATLTSLQEVPPEVAVAAAPASRRLARELGVEIAQVTGTGPEGRISIDDVKEHARALIGSRQVPTAVQTGAGLPARPPLPDFSRWGDIERLPMSGVRRKTAENVAVSWAVVPHVTQADRADITELEEVRKRWRAKAEAVGGKLTITAIVLKVVASALRMFPQVNASLDTDRQEIIHKRYIHLGVAVDAEHGLLVPVIRNADTKSILAIASELADLSKRARSKKLAVEQMQGASFTVTNLGGLGTTYFSPIVGWPQAAALGLGRALNEAVWTDGQFRPRLILPLSLSYDHRIIDGADGARFLRWVAEALEEPIKLVLEG